MLRRTPNALRASLPAILLGCVALAACGGGGGDAAEAGSTTTAPAAVDRLRAGPVTVERTADAGAADPATVAGLVGAADGYLRAASLDPLAGRPVRLDAVTTEPARPLTLGPAAETLTDAGVGRLRDLRVDARPAPVTVLTDPEGAPVLGTVTIDLTLSGRNDRGAVRIHRTGELAFVREGTGWRLDSWRLTVTRDGRGLPPASRTSSTTAAP